MNPPIHLDSARWTRLLQGTMDLDERQSVAHHLQEACEVCETFLVDAEGVDALDGLVDETLLALAGARREGLPDELGFRRVLTALQAGENKTLDPARKASRSRRQKRYLSAALLAAAAGFLLLILLPRPRPEELGDEGFRFKGETPRSASLRLEVLRAEPQGGVVPLAQNTPVHSGDQLVFRIGLVEPSCVQLWQDDGKLKALLVEPLCLPAGNHVLQRDGQVLGLSVGSQKELSLIAAPASEGPESKARDTYRLRVKNAN